MSTIDFLFNFIKNNTENSTESIKKKNFFLSKEVFSAKAFLVLTITALVLDIIYLFFLKPGFLENYLNMDHIEIMDFCHIWFWIFNFKFAVTVVYNVLPYVYSNTLEFFMVDSETVYENFVDLKIHFYKYIIIVKDNPDTYLFNDYHDIFLFIEKLINNVFSLTFLTETFDNAWYLKFGYLFVLTTIASLFYLSYLGLYGVFIVNFVPLFLFWVSSLCFLKKIFYEKCFFIINFGKWFIFNMNQKIFFELYIDYITISFTVLTLTIAMFVYIYCFSYFRYEPNVERLMLFINLFVISMILLVSSGNLIVLFLGWELIGLTSFFLINFWSTRISTLKAAFKAFIFNKFSDISILIACILCYLLINDFNILVLNNEISFYVNYYIKILNYEISYIELLSFFLLSAAFIKSAQFGTHIWLPDSMEAPVPASALIHSATLVSAGVFLLLRFTPIFELSNYVFIVLPVIGSFTAFFGGICAAYQSDIKKILAYSTISHCGFLMVSFSTNVVEYTLLYLYIHGFFKAAVFLCVGNVIRFSRNYQDFRRMGGLYKYLPLECICSFLCLINLAGLPFTFGFYIKHVLLIGLPTYMNIFVFLNVIGGALSGIVYSYRLYFYVFFDFKKAKKPIYMQSNRMILKSKYYSNTTLASNIAISGLILMSYLISFYFFNLCLLDIKQKSEFSHFSFNTSSVFEYYNSSISFLKNISYINWLIIFVILLTYLVKWRYFYNYSFFLNKFYFIIKAIIFTYVFAELLFLI